MEFAGRGLLWSLSMGRSIHVVCDSVCKSTPQKIRTNLVVKTSKTYKTCKICKTRKTIRFSTSETKNVVKLVAPNKFQALSFVGYRWTLCSAARG